MKNFTQYQKKQSLQDCAMSHPLTAELHELSLSPSFLALIERVRADGG